MKNNQIYLFLQKNCTSHRDTSTTDRKQSGFGSATWTPLCISLVSAFLPELFKTPSNTLLQKHFRYTTATKLHHEGERNWTSVSNHCLGWKFLHPLHLSGLQRRLFEEQPSCISHYISEVITTTWLSVSSPSRNSVILCERIKTILSMHTNSFHNLSIHQNKPTANREILPHQTLSPKITAGQNPPPYRGAAPAIQPLERVFCNK